MTRNSGNRFAIPIYRKAFRSLDGFFLRTGDGLKFTPPIMKIVIIEGALKAPLLVL